MSCEGNHKNQDPTREIGIGERHLHLFDQLLRPTQGAAARKFARRAPRGYGSADPKPRGPYAGRGGGRPSFGLTKLTRTANGSQLHIDGEKHPR